MDGGEAARRMVGCGDAFRNKAMINPIMMRFRPIAPKPVAGGSVSGGASSVDGKNTLISKGRTKRKYVRVRRYNRKKKTTRNSGSDGNKNGEFVDQSAVTTTMTMTLQLLPERRADDFDFDFAGGRSLPSEFDLADNRTERSYLYSSVRRTESDVVLVSDRRDAAGAVELWVTVECVTDACMDLQLQQDLGCTDEERIKNLEADTCPGFISDGMNRVERLNKAFKRMVRQRQRSDSESPAEIGVWFISKPRLPYSSRGFTCQIKLQFKWGTDMDKDSKVVPCDAWRMDGGGFAWKLDVKAALTLAPLLQD